MFDRVGLFSNLCPVWIANGPSKKRHGACDVRCGRHASRAAIGETASMWRPVSTRIGGSSVLIAGDAPNARAMSAQILCFVQTPPVVPRFFPQAIKTQVTTILTRLTNYRCGHNVFSDGLQTIAPGKRCEKQKERERERQTD